MFLPSNITLKFGDSGDFVAELQRRLARVNCFAEDQVNGFFDGNTTQAVTSFQAREGLRADGVAGPETLRRLNGVIAGDTSSASSDKKEEEKAAQAITQDIMLNAGAESAYDPFAIAPATHAPYGEEAYRPSPEAAPSPAPAPVAEPVRTPPAPEPRAADLALKQELAAPAPVPNPPAADLLADMLLKTAPAAAAAAPAPQPSEFKAAAPVVPPQPERAPLPPTAEEPAAAPAQGLVGKARQFASGMMQKLSEYFEAKLPPSVLKEVQAIGSTMAQAGLKEAPIPTGPELPDRAPSLPARGPEAAPQR